MEQQYIQETTWLEMQVKIVFLSLDKNGDVVIGGTVVLKSRPYIPFTVVGENTKSFRVQRKDLKFVFIDVKPSAEGGKWKIVAVTRMWIVMAML